jgi:hypothetical protein
VDDNADMKTREAAQQLATAQSGSSVSADSPGGEREEDEEEIVTEEYRLIGDESDA